MATVVVHREGAQGSDGAGASVDEGFITLVAVPGRFRALLDRYGTLEQLDGPLRARRTPGAWSALELIGHVADSLHASARCAVALADGEGGRLSRPLHIDAPRAGVNSAPIRAVLGALQASAADLARVLSVAPLDHQARSIGRSSASSEAGALLARAVGESDGHLADVEALLDGVVGSSARASTTAPVGRPQHGGCSRGAQPCS